MTTAQSHAIIAPLVTLRCAFGVSVMNKFHDAYAGQAIHIPLKLLPDNPMIAIIGLEAVAALIEACGGTAWEIPSNRERRVCQLFEEGKTPNEIATELTMTSRGVRRLLRVCGLSKHQKRLPRTGGKRP